MSVYRIGILVGSIRKGSFSQALANAAIRLAPESLELTQIDIGSLAFFNQDVENSGQIPQEWTDFRTALAKCDGFLFVTPEYNRSIPALMKNAVDVGSRPNSENTWSGKPGAIISQSPGHTGGFGANHALRQALVYPNVIVMGQPEAYFGDVTNAIDMKTGNVTDDRTLKFLGKFMESFSEWVARQKGDGSFLS